MYKLLFSHFGDQHWWPGDSPFEVCIGAILTQNTAWKNVEKAIASLKKERKLSIKALQEMSEAKLGELIKASGYYNVKAKRLKNFISHVVRFHQGSLKKMFETDVKDLRSELLSINGIGKETADCIILYAAEKPIFVVDAYTKRILQRHGFIKEKTSYDDIQCLFESHLKPDIKFYNDFHAQIVATGNQYCRKTPRCNECPLKNSYGRHV